MLRCSSAGNTLLYVRCLVQGKPSWTFWPEARGEEAMWGKQEVRIRQIKNSTEKVIYCFSSPSWWTMGNEGPDKSSMYEAWAHVLHFLRSGGWGKGDLGFTCGSSGRILIHCGHGTVTLLTIKDEGSYFHIIVGARCGLGAGLSYNPKVSDVWHLAMSRLTTWEWKATLLFYL